MVGLVQRQIFTSQYSEILCCFKLLDCF